MILESSLPLPLNLGMEVKPLAASGKQESDETLIVQVLAQILFLRKGLPSPPNLSYTLTPSLSVNLAYFHIIFIALITI